MMDAAWWAVRRRLSSLFPGDLDAAWNRIYACNQWMMRSFHSIGHCIREQLAMARLWAAESAPFFKRSAAEQQQCPVEQQQGSADADAQCQTGQCQADAAGDGEEDGEEELATQARQTSSHQTPGIMSH